MNAICLALSPALRKVLDDVQAGRLPIQEPCSLDALIKADIAASKESSWWNWLFTKPEWVEKHLPAVVQTVSVSHLYSCCALHALNSVQICTDHRYTS